MNMLVFLGRFVPIFYFNFENVLFVYIVEQIFADFIKKKNLWIFNFQKYNFVKGKFLKIRSSIFPQKYRARLVQLVLCLFDTNGQTDKHQDKQIIYID